MSAFFLLGFFFFLFFFFFFFFFSFYLHLPTSGCVLVCGSGNVQNVLNDTKTQKHKKDIENIKRDTKQHKMDKDCVCECVGAHCM